jgi:hypothetical protein
MKKYIGAVAALALAAPLVGAAQTPPVEAQIAEAVQILPEDLRAGATVVTYDRTTGGRKVLRQGTNFLECQPKAPDGHERCYHKMFAPRRDLEAKLQAEKKSEKEIAEAMAAAVKAGTIPPSPPAMMAYRNYDKTDRIQKLWVMSLPNRTPESVGVSTAPQRDAALKGEGLPWMMPGRGRAIMIPIAEASKITDEAPDASRRPCPCPGSPGGPMKRDPTTGERRVLRPHEPGEVCAPRRVGSPGATTRSLRRVDFAASCGRRRKTREIGRDGRATRNRRFRRRCSA